MVTSDNSLVTLYFQLHLPCDKNIEGKAGGRTQQGVSKYGHMLARHTRPDLAQIGPISAVVTSALPRAIETASLYFQDSDLPIIQDERLSSIDYGQLEDMPVADLLALQAQHIDQAFPGGESFLEMSIRYESCLNDLAQKWAGSRMLVIAHNESTPMLRHLCDNIPLAEALARAVAPKASGTRIVEYYRTVHGPFVYRQRASTK